MRYYKIARAGLHHFEEPCISGERGSGTVFFSGCDLKCVFCQNYEISRKGKGLLVAEEQLIRIMEYLVGEGAENINLVTPSIWTDKLKDTLKIAKERVKVPFVWNSSGYESVASLRELDGLIDVYLPDFKYSDDALALSYSGARGYFDVAYAAISEMRRQRPEDSFEGGMMKKGVIVRHLVLPGALANTRGVLNAISKIDKNLYVSLMSQYFPAPAVSEHPVLSRRLTEEEYDLAREYFFEAGLKFGFSQELDSATEEYVPDFDLDALEKIL